MSDEKRKVLEMLEAGKISQQDAERLLEALGETGEAEPAPAGQPDPANREEGGVPKLTLYPEGDEALADEISRTVEDTIEQAQKEYGNDWNAIGEKINDAVTNKMNAVFGGAPTPPELPELGGSLPADGTPYDYPNLDDKVESLTIDWISGPVEIRRGENDVLKVTEYANRPLKDGERLELRVDDGEVSIRFSRERSFWINFGLPGLVKHLVIELPRSLEQLEDLAVKNVSGDVYIDGLEGEDFSVSTVSGKVCAANLRAEDLKLVSVSGEIQATGVSAEDLHVSSTSGKVQVGPFDAEDAAVSTVSGSVQAMGRGESVSASTTSGSVELKLTAMPDEVKMHSVSGKLVLSLPDSSMGFSVKYNSRSGRFSSDFPLSGNLGNKSGNASYKDGETEINMNTLSGSMELHRA